MKDNYHHHYFTLLIVNENKGFYFRLDGECAWQGGVGRGILGSEEGRQTVTGPFQAESRPSSNHCLSLAFLSNRLLPALYHMNQG